jgi:hypothetical protein
MWDLERGMQEILCCAGSLKGQREQAFRKSKAETVDIKMDHEIKE